MRKNFTLRIPYLADTISASAGVSNTTGRESNKKYGETINGIQAYYYRMCLTDYHENRIPFEKPGSYNQLEYELLFRNYEAGETRIPWISSSMPNRKTDTYNKHSISTDFIGQNYNYPEATYAERKTIAERHHNYPQGLMCSLAYHPRIPEHIRKEVSRWGICKDDFPKETSMFLQTQKGMNKIYAGSIGPWKCDMNMILYLPEIPCIK